MFDATRVANQWKWMARTAVPGGASRGGKASCRQFKIGGASMVAVLLALASITALLSTAAHAGAQAGRAGVLPSGLLAAQAVSGQFQSDSAHQQATVMSPTVDSWGQSAVITPSDGVSESRFGASVAIDGSTLVVGAPTGGPGVVYVYTFGSGGGWGSAGIAKLVASDTLPNDRFGAAVAIDGNTIVVGASGHAVGPDNIEEGAVYLFEEPASGWSGTLTETAKLRASDMQSGDAYAFFGWKVAIAGDTVAVGAPAFMEEDGQGSVYIFAKPASGWQTTTETAKLTPNPRRNMDWFGYYLAMSGDTVLVSGSGYETTPGSDLWALAYLYEKPVDGWQTMTSPTTALVKMSDDGRPEAASVAIDGDTVVIAEEDTERLLIYGKPASGWPGQLAEMAQLSPSGGESAPFAVGSMTIDGGLIAAGVPYGLSPAVYLYARPETGWISATETISLTAGGTNNRFGASVALDMETLVVGAPDTDQRTGAVYVFQPEADNTIGDDGGAITSDDETVQIIFPANAVDKPVSVMISTSTTVSHATGTFKFAGVAFTIEASDQAGQPVTQFTQPYTLTVNYSDSDWQNAGIEHEAALTLRYWDGSAWKRILPCGGCSHNLDTNQFVVVLDHLTDFAILAHYETYLPALLR